MNSTRFAIAVDILMRATTRGERKLTSEVIAHSLNTNPAFIRRILSQLSRADVARSLRGTGGVVLCRAPEHITLADVLRAVEPERVEWLLPTHRVSLGQEGEQIHKILCATFRAIEKTTIGKLARVTIADLLASE